MVNGRSVASEFLGFRRGSASKKARHKPDTANERPRSRHLERPEQAGADVARLARIWRDLGNAESAKPVFDSHQSTGILFLNEIAF
jgi:hypothetical protein